MRGRPDLIAIDLDGTLLDREHRISERAAAAIDTLARRGTAVVLATGRPPRLTSAYVHDLRLEHALVFNGASRYHAPSRSCVHHHQMPRAVALEILRRLRDEVPDVRLGLETHHGWYLDPHLEARRRDHPMLVTFPPPDGVGEVEHFVQDAVIKIFARHDTLDAAGMMETLAACDVYLTWTNTALLEVMHPEVNKRDALERLAAELGVDRTSVAAFGDARNDVEVLAWAGHGVAMADACPEAREAADEVAGAHHEDGVAEVLERWT